MLKFLKIQEKEHGYQHWLVNEHSHVFIRKVFVAQQQMVIIIVCR